MIIEAQDGPDLDGDKGKGIEKISMSEEMINYYFGEEEEEPQPFAINSFERVGWADPFPNEANLAKEQDLELAR